MSVKSRIDFETAAILIQALYRGFVLRKLIAATRSEFEFICSDIEKSIKAIQPNYRSMVQYHVYGGISGFRDEICDGYCIFNGSYSEKIRSQEGSSSLKSTEDNARSLFGEVNVDDLRREVVWLENAIRERIISLRK